MTAQLEIAFPALAGMNRTRDGRYGVRSRVPRTRGDEPLPLLRIVMAVLRSPHSRG